MRVDTSGVPAPAAPGGVVRLPRKNLALFLRPSGTLHPRQLSQGAPPQPPPPQPPPPSSPDEPCPTSSVLTSPKRCLTGFVLTMFIYVSVVVPAWGFLVWFCFPHQSKQG